MISIKSDMVFDN